MKTVVITGINGQLGQFLAKYLLKNEPDIKIVGTVRHKSFDDQPYIFDRSLVTFELMDLSDSQSIESIVMKHKPDYFINTAANAYVGESWKIPEQQISLNSVAVLHQLESIRKHSPHTRYFNMGTSEEFGVSKKTGPQDETTKLDPKSPYGCAKCAARHIVSVWRQSYNLYAIQGWTFNFESPIRGNKYVTRKVTQNVARITKEIRGGNFDFAPGYFGNVNSFRSWQHAEDVADGVWRMLNQEKYRSEIIKEDGKVDISLLKEYVLSAPDTHSVREFIEKAFAVAGIKGVWWNSKFGIDPFFDEYILSNDGVLATKRYVPLIKMSQEFYRPSDVTYLYGDATRARIELGWRPKISFEELVIGMVKSDLAAVGIEI